MEVYYPTEHQPMLKRWMKLEKNIHVRNSIEGTVIAKNDSYIEAY
jgi:hypothetical protein